jgi:uncharacterized protein (DUF736 family)
MEKHMIIGHFTDQNPNAAFAGNLYGINLGGFVFLQPAKAKTGNGPDFIVWGGARDEEDAVEIGAAWRKTSKKGRAYLSVKLDSPALPQPINCALTEQRDGSHALVWNRSDAKADEQSAEAV